MPLTAVNSQRSHSPAAPILLLYKIFLNIIQPQTWEQHVGAASQLHFRTACLSLFNLFYITSIRLWFFQSTYKTLLPLNFHLKNNGTFHAFVANKLQLLAITCLTRRITNVPLSPVLINTLEFARRHYSELITTQQVYHGTLSKQTC